MEKISGKAFFSSWSGGKDSCLAFYHAVRSGGTPKRLFCMLNEDGTISKSHGIPKALLEKQAGLLNVDIAFRSATWEGYEAAFLTALYEFREGGIEHGVFGDIDIEEHREWCVTVCGKCGLQPLHPLWKRPRRELLLEFIDLGFKAVIVSVNAEKLGREWLGRTITAGAVGELEAAGIDICGEQGEYHTFVTGGPLFAAEIAFSAGEPVLRDGYWFLPLHQTDR